MDINAITRPTLLLDEQKAKQHIAMMSQKNRDAHAIFRPHFKTHQSAEIGEWFRATGVQAITVSSVEMAFYFADNGWVDILIAFPVNIRDLTSINLLARRVTLHILVDSVESAHKLNQALDTTVYVWIEVDTGSNRSGIHWQDERSLKLLSSIVSQASHLSLVGLLTYVGITYTARTPQQIKLAYGEAIGHISYVQRYLHDEGHSMAISIGDTPSCSVLHELGEVDELRPGNFVFYDLMQAQIGSCTVEDIAVGIACPIVAKRASNQLIIYGGGVHFSKEHIVIDEKPVFGQVALLGKQAWQPVLTSKLARLSQEHGVIDADGKTFDMLNVGDLVVILPAHACMTAALYGHYYTLEGRRISKMRINDR
jgi:D-serine deaminase-like pyridoxal phosphate-dependent protein